MLRHEFAGLAALGEQIRGVLYSGENFPLPEMRELHRALPHARVVNCFGSSESIAASFTDVPNPLPAEVDRISIGHAHPGAEMLLIDEDGRPVDTPGVVGQIHLRSAALFHGYWNDPEATAAALVPDPLNPASGQVVFRTGDLAYRGRAANCTSSAGSTPWSRSVATGSNWARWSAGSGTSRASPEPPR